MQQLWAMIKEKLAEKLTPCSLETWFGDAELLSAEGNTLVLYIDNDFKKKMIEQHFIANIKAALSDLLSAEFEVKIITEEEEYQKVLASRSFVSKDALPQMADYTFDRFIVGTSNRLAYTVARQIADKPGGQYNPLFLYGGTGLGKTHLLLAIGQYIRDTGRTKNIVYIKGDEFINKMIAAIQTRTTDLFHEKFRSADLLLVDDVHCMAGKPSAQEEFLCTIDAMYEAGKQIVITCDLPPHALPSLNDRLRTCFECGIIADILPPDKETRKDIIRFKAQELNLFLSESEIESTAEKLTGNVRKIEGFLKTLSACRSILGTEYSPNNMISDCSGYAVNSAKLTPEKIIKETARCFSVTENDIRGPSRLANISLARHAAMYIIRYDLMMPFKEIGHEFGDRRHPSVISSVKKAESLIASDAAFSDAVESIRQSLLQNKS